MVSIQTQFLTQAYTHARRKRGPCERLTNRGLMRLVENVYDINGKAWEGVGLVESLGCGWR